MAKQITKFGWFTVPEWQKEEKWLNEQHKKGWKLIKVTFPGFYKFEACEPEDVVYQLDYNKDGMRNLSEYIQLFRDCGWEYITDMAGYAYFRKPASEMANQEEGIFSDEESKMEMITRVFKGRILLLAGLFLCCILPQFLHMDKWLSLGVMGYGIIGFVSMVFIMYVVLFVQFAVQYFRTKKRIARK